MSDAQPPKKMSDKHNSLHAKKRRARRDAAGGAAKFRKRPSIERENNKDLLIYGLHPVRHALRNQDRIKTHLFATRNGLDKLEVDVRGIEGLQVEEKHPRDLDRMVGSDAVHQGVVMQVEPLAHNTLENLGDTNLVLVLDQVTDPHNVGAIMRSCVAMKAGALITASRYSPAETGVLAKSASGGLELINHIEVRNLAETLEALSNQGFTTVGLDSEGETEIEALKSQQKIALVLGAEGKGLRQRTRETCNHLVRLDMPGEIKSLNVSNAAVLSLYIAKGMLD